MYLEGIVSLPRDESDLGRVRGRDPHGQAGRRDDVARTVMLSGRRYETFDSAASFRRFADRASIPSRWRRRSPRDTMSGWPSRTTRTGAPTS